MQELHHFQNEHIPHEEILQVPDDQAQLPEQNFRI